MTMDRVDLAVYWNRLVSIATEGAATLQRIAFSQILTQAFDFAVVLCSPEGELVAQPEGLGLQAFVGCLASTVPEMVRHFDGDIHPGDVYITNEPWIGSSQLNDYFVVSPIFHDDSLVAFAANVAHSPDVGGGGLLSAESHDVFSEGLQVPIMRLMDRGVENQTLMAIIRQNVRVPDLVRGDLDAQVATNAVMSRRVEQFLTDTPNVDIKVLFDEILGSARQSMADAIDRLPDGTYGATIETDGLNEPLHIEVAVTIDGPNAVLDFSGTSPQVDCALNCTSPYVVGTSLHALVCAVRPGGPINAGTARPVTLKIPPASVLNPDRPAALASRAYVAQYVHGLILRALAPVAPAVIPAECGAPVWAPVVMGVGSDGRPFVEAMIMTCGVGARPHADGLSCIGFPDNVSSFRPETIEEDTPLIVEMQQFADGSGGAGQFTGGRGQVVRLKSRSAEPIHLALRTERLRHPARGLAGGESGSPGHIRVNGEEVTDGKQTLILHWGDTVEFVTPGGGGFGSPDKVGLGSGAPS
jgi:N-methylhydantoinase B